jgi:hypothetical protein
MIMKTQFKDKVIHQAGYFYAGEWVAVGRGESAKKAKDALVMAIGRNPNLDLSGYRYEESHYTYTAAAQERDQ